jgi:hypothetical protein
MKNIVLYYIILYNVNQLNKVMGCCQSDTSKLRRIQNDMEEAKKRQDICQAKLNRGEQLTPEEENQMKKDGVLAIEGIVKVMQILAKDMKKM